MGNTQCVKCGISKDSPYINNKYLRKHCRFHKYSDKNNLICMDCSENVDSNSTGCYHRFKFVLCGLSF